MKKDRLMNIMCQEKQLLVFRQLLRMQTEQGFVKGILSSSARSGWMQRDQSVLPKERARQI